jgi:hypothetical protein
MRASTSRFVWSFWFFSFLIVHSGTVIATPGLWVTPLELDFGSVGVGVTSPQQVVNITNTGDTLLTNFAGGAPADNQFGASQNCAGGVAPGATCQYFFTFTPTSVGTFESSSNSGTNAGPFTIILRGTGVGPQLHVTPLEIDFGPVVQNVTSPMQTVEIENEGLSELTNFAGGAPSDNQFGASQNCAGGVAPGASCQYFFTFTPTSLGTFESSSNSGTNAGPFTIILRGTGVQDGPGVDIQPANLDFGEVTLGETSDPQTATFTNIGNVAINVASVVAGLPFSVDSENCTPGLPPGESCEIEVLFAPTSEGSASDQLAVTHDAPGSPSTVGLTGIGLKPKALFNVTKVFEDGNPGDAQVTLSCNTGLPLQQTASIPGGDPQGVTFVVVEFESGTMDCEVTEAPIIGYSPTYLAAPGGVSLENCDFVAVATNSMQSCEITNAVEPVDVAITKEWVVDGGNPLSVDTTFSLTLLCDAEIVGGVCILQPDSSSGAPVLACSIEFIGNQSQTFVAQVVPEYPTSSCAVTESVYDSAVEVENGCGGLTVSAGSGDSCTVTNTVFFDGIPTLDRYALTLLSLMMLTFGWVACRRMS